ncbi:MAG TPA: AAA family ATPase [Candidatus Diapherotrites archaeon]|uniref:AAA family ATPase n=1 Tax=Candidatus Iainarchaeum sp. TaxID=3101447 RepID=A0A7J4IUM2_9ARCH|nr:AAA family ATPase [Candidatus Diapherotrites archaeon]
MAVIVIVGLARSGKDSAADYIAEKYGYSKYTFSSVLSEMLEEKGELPEKEKMIALGDKLRAETGMDALAKLLEGKIGQKDNVILVGPRSIEEIEYFKNRFPKLSIIKITADASKRFNRKSRMDPQGKKEFFGRDSRDVESKGMQKVLDAAQSELKNNGTRKSLHAQVDNLMKRINAAN